MPRWVALLLIAGLAIVPPVLFWLTLDPLYLTAMLLVPLIWIGRRR